MKQPAMLTEMTRPGEKGSAMAARCCAIPGNQKVTSSGPARRTVRCRACQRTFNQRKDLGGTIAKPEFIWREY